MRKTKYTFILLVAFQLIFFVSTKYNCDTKERIYLNPGSTAYFETNILTKKQFSDCNLTFALANNNTDYHLIISTTEKLYNSNFIQINQTKSSNILQTLSYSLHTHASEQRLTSHNFIVLKGFVVFADSSKILNCINDEEPVAISNNLDIHFIGTSNFTSKKCIWRFIGPQNYGFKVVILELDDDVSETEIFVRNSTDTFVNKRSAKKTYAHYNDDSYLEIQLSKNHGTQFYAYVSIVSKTLGTEKCYTTKNATTTTWHILPAFNTKCFLEVIIPATTEIIVTVKGFDIETNVDYIRYTDKYNYSTTVDVYASTDTIFKLFNYNNGSNTRYLFEYSNDGSRPSFGQYIKFTKISCRCVAPVISCLTFFSLTGIMDKDDLRYCGNLHCNFTIEACVQSGGDVLTEMTYRYNSDMVDINEYTGDIFRTYSNGHLTSAFEMNDFKTTETDYLAFFNKSNFNMLEVITFPSKAVKEITIVIQTKPNFPPVYAKKEISSQTPFIVIDLVSYRITTHHFEPTVVKVTASKESIFINSCESLKASPVLFVT